MLLTLAGLCQLSKELETNGGITMKYLILSLRDPLRNSVNSADRSAAL